ncbi:nitrous oxide reductase family maturation protein NosD [Parvularcula sp. IMCC14364]|uniref:right-handed parallel beta-helix repeat-containing protein n=1 Tax=Parvularcula sp. IMCC14364 TaxID=3067902 RepID=UPI002740919A|nr:NosD domain-containing protein [Parvularcula sp. IMCC14364]
MRRVAAVLTTLIVFSALLLSPSAVAQYGPVVSRTEGPYYSLRNAIADAGPGGTIRIKNGRYAASDLEIPYDLTIIGEGEVILTSVRPVAKGLLVPLRGVSLEVRGLIFENATSPDKNGAGIRVEGNELIVRDSIFRNNENGILATGSDGSEVTISGSQFISNGYGDGYSHGIYISSATRLEVTGSRFEGSRIGHHIKSVATQQTIVRNTFFDDRDGQPSYMIDATAGGMLVVDGNVMHRRASAEQESLINYDTSRGGQRGNVIIQNNQVTNEKPNARLLRNTEKAAVFLSQNSFDNINGGTLELPVSTPELYQAAPEGGLPVVEQKTIREQANLDTLTPTQRRAVERMLEGGQKLRVIEPSDQLAQEQVRRDAQERDGVARREREASTVIDTPPARTAQPDINGAVVRGILMAPAFQPTSQQGDLVAVRLTRLRDARATSGIITFGQAFRRGQLMPSDPLTMRVGGRRWVMQKDIKALHSDGSVRHAVITLFVPPNQQQPLIQGVLSKSASVPAEPALVPDLNGYNLTVAITGETADGADFSEEVALADMIRSEIEAGTFWLQGELATEVSVYREIGPLLALRADVRFLADRTVRTRLVFENHKTFTDGNRDLTYNVSVRDGDARVMQRDNIEQYRGSNWSEIIWKGRRPAYGVQLDPAHLISANTIAPFDLTFGVNAAAIAANAEKLRKETGIFSAGLMMKYMPTTGNRQDIGVLPEWDVQWLKTQNRQAYDIMIAMAERAGSVPWHYMDDKTGQPVRVDERPKFWAEERGTDYRRETDRIPEAYFSGSDGGWTPDSAHKPLLSYTAYLVTGDAYYKRSLAHEAAFAISQIWPDLREEAAIVTEAIQVRSRAWALRDVGAAAWILPDAHPLKVYFEKSLSDSIGHLFRRYTLEGRMDAAGETEGWFAEEVNGEPARVSPWQNDYMMMVLSLEAMRGSPVAGEVIAWAANYHTGRFLADGADPALGAVYTHALKDEQTEEPVGSWSEMISRTQNYEGASESYPNDAGGYVSSAYASLASIYAVTGSQDAVRAMQALAAVHQGTTLFDPANKYSVYNTANYLLALREPDGTVRSISDVLESD